MAVATYSFLLESFLTMTINGPLDKAVLFFSQLAERVGFWREGISQIGEPVFSFGAARKPGHKPEEIRER